MTLGRLSRFVWNSGQFPRQLFGLGICCEFNFVVWIWPQVFRRTSLLSEGLNRITNVGTHVILRIYGLVEVLCPVPDEESTWVECRVLVLGVDLEGVTESERHGVGNAA